MSQDQPPTTTKANIVESVYGLGGFTKRQSADLVALVFETIKENLEKGTKIKISGFGNFEVRVKNPRPGRNPQTGEEILIEGRRILKFKPSQILKDGLNDEGGDGG
jgi:integration host factor subunit alpha